MRIPPRLNELFVFLGFKEADHVTGDLREKELRKKIKEQGAEPNLDGYYDLVDKIEPSKNIYVLPHKTAEIAIKLGKQRIHKIREATASTYLDDDEILVRGIGGERLK